MSVTLQSNFSDSLSEPLSPAVIFDSPALGGLAEVAHTTRDELLQQLCERLGRPT